MRSVIDALPYWHVDALAWFEANAGRTFPTRPFDVGLSIKATSLHKGIWKPSGTRYAVSVVQTHKGAYPDQTPTHAPDGTWCYSYHQQGSTAEDLKDPTRHFANVALFANQVDGIPVGVVIPEADGRGYTVLGLATIERFDRGMFTLCGPVSLIAEEPVAQAPDSQVTVALIDFSPTEFDPDETDDGRQKTIAEVIRRQGQPHFRRQLLDAYDRRCAMSNFDAEPALEAAHILPYRGRQTNHPANGLLLRADLHDLFDLGLIAVDAGEMRLRLADALVGTMYEPMDGETLRVPSDAALRPSEVALEKHWARSAVA